MARGRKAAAGRDAAPKTMLWKIGLYIRLSRDDGNDESLSVTNQRKILIEYVQRFFQGAYVLVDEYIDDGKTGTDYDRPGFQRLLHDVERARVNCILCKNLSRAFRNYADQGYFIESFFPLHGTRFITLGEPKVDTFLHPEAVSGLEVPINGLMNDRFAAQTSGSVRRTFDNKRRNGEFIGAFAPYGYVKDPADKNAIIVDHEAARVVQDIFQWYVYGDGLGTESLSKEGIARKLNELGVPNPTLYKTQKGLRYRNPRAKENDGLWTGSSVARILKNKVYIGTMVQGRQRVISYKVHKAISMPQEQWYQVEHTHEAIISQELFAKAQQLQQKDIRRAPHKRETYLFSGFLKCADCGKSMTRRAASRFVYYYCSTYKRKSKELCSKHTMRLDALERTVLMVIQKHIMLAAAMEEAAGRVKGVPAARDNAAGLEKLLQQRQRELERTGEMLAGLYLDWKNGDISRAQHRELRERFVRQQAKLQQAAEHIREEMKAVACGCASADPSLQYFLAHRNIDRLTRGLLVELIDSIYVHENGAVTIVFKFCDQYGRMSVV